MVYLNFTEENGKVRKNSNITFKISLGQVIYCWGNIPQCCIWLSLQLCNINHNLKCCKVSHDLFICWSFLMSWWQWAHVGKYLIKFNKPLRQLVRWLMCQKTEYLAEKCSFEGKLKLFLIFIIFSKYFKISCFGVLSRAHGK